MSQFQYEACSGLIQRTTQSQLIVEGRFHMAVRDNAFAYVAAAPADLRASFTGSALPFASPEMALQNTPNRGTARLDPITNSFSIKLRMPNSYYAGHGTALVPPTLYIKYVPQSQNQEKVISIKLDESIPYRTLTYPNKRTSPTFYDVQLPVRSQERILRDSAYPTDNPITPSNHWGLKPPF